MNDITESAPGRNLAVDAYIAKAAPFARPILVHVRQLVHATCPSVIEEMKWGMPFFVHHGNLCHMAAFKAHCGFGFWRGKELPGIPEPDGGSAMGSFGRIASVDDLPSSRRLATLIRAAMELNERSRTSARPPARSKGVAKAAIEMPADVAAALAADAAAAAHFAAFTPGAQREYLEWIVEAKRPATRTGRIATLVVQCAEGKTRHWKYQR